MIEKILKKFARYFVFYLGDQALKLVGIVEWEEFVDGLSLDKKNFIKKFGQVILKRDLYAKPIELQKEESYIIYFILGLAMDNFFDIIKTNGQTKIKGLEAIGNSTIFLDKNFKSIDGNPMIRIEG